MQNEEHARLILRQEVTSPKKYKLIRIVIIK